MLVSKARQLLAVYAITLVLLYSCVGCVSTTGLPYEKAFEIAPSELLRSAYARASECAPEFFTRRPAFEELRFFVVDTIGWNEQDNGLITVGQVPGYGRKIYVTIYMSTQEWIWAHEIMHTFRRPDNSPMQHDRDNKFWKACALNGEQG
jgi:hypothetical protein